MERTVPSTASEEIELYLRTLYSLLRSTAEVQIRALEEVHAGMNSLLHPDARKTSPDVSALIYTSLRLPVCMPSVRSIVLGQSPAVFSAHGYDGIENWQPVSARARRRRCFFDGRQTLACFIASRSDIEDVVPSLTAYQIEWNKLHVLLKNCPASLLEPAHDSLPALAQAIKIELADLHRLQTVWGKDFYTILNQMAERPLSLGIRLLSGSLSEYWRATRQWWENIEKASPALLTRPVYFISSNTHSIANILSGFAFQHRSELIEYLHGSQNPDLQSEWSDIQNCQVPSSEQNFLFYLLKKAQQTAGGSHLIGEQAQVEKERGILRIAPEHSFDMEAQVIELCRLDPQLIDSRLRQNRNGEENLAFLRESDALILNIDYPLGMSAYNILTKLAEHLANILGVYVIGKAAILNGVRGDVMIPNVVQDEQSHNTYLFQNAFTAADISPYLAYGSVLDNQKALSALGTFLQNAHYMDVMYREGYTDIEMESGPYLSAVYEMVRPKRHPVDEIVALLGIPFDLGILHYASDKPLSKGRNLGSATLSYRGMDSTYAASVAVLRRIVALEKRRLSERRSE